MEFQSLIKASSMIRSVMGNMIEDSEAEGKMTESIGKLKDDLSCLEKLIDE